VARPPFACVLFLGLLALPAAALADPFVINEVVNDPQSDWNHSTGGTGEPFDGTPGPGAPNSDSDEYIELKNVSGQIQSLAGYTLLMDDVTTPASDLFDPNAPDPNQHSQYYRVFDPNGVRVMDDPLNAVPAGGYVVLGNPGGTMNLSITLTLKDPSQTVIDEVVIGGTGNPSGEASSTANEALSRFPDGTDTGSGLADFVQRSSTPGRSNGTYCSVQSGQAVVNEVVGDPFTDWNGSGGPPDSDHDEYVELKNVSGSALSFIGCVLDMADTSPASFLFLDADSNEPRVEVHDPNGNLIGTAPALASVPAGGYVVLFDPPGQMNATGTTALTLRNGPPGNPIDQVALALDAGGAADESVSRFPDGADSGVDAADFFRRTGSPGRSNGAGSAGTPGLQLINEVVLDPFQDFNADGAVTSADQAIELLNKSGQTIDLTGWRLRMLDSSPRVDAVNAFEVVTFSAGGSIEAWDPNEYVTLVHPGATMNDDVYIELVNYLGNAVDAVEIGGNSATTDFAGNGAGNGAPEPGANGEAFGIGDSAIARVPDGMDTNHDPNDFLAQEPTLGASNTITRNDATAPALDPNNTTTGSNFPVSGRPRVSFNEAVATSIVRESLVLLRRGGALPTDPPLAQGLALENTDKTVTITPRAVLQYSTSYQIVLFSGITDRAGNALLPAPDPNDGLVAATFTTEPAPGNPAAVRINEAVPDPQRDWGGGSFKNSGAPQGFNSSVDEWVELYNPGPGSVDLTNWTLSLIDGTRSSVRIGDELSGRVVVCFNASGVVTGDDLTNCYASLPAGFYLIVGDPPGSMSNDIYLELRNASGAVVDSVEIGGGTASTDFGGDGAGNGAPAGSNAAALGLFDESVARRPNGADTGSDLLDWRKQLATLGRSNDLSPPADTDPPGVLSVELTRRLGGLVRVDTDLRITFDEPMDLATIDGETVFLESGIERRTLSFEFDTRDTVAVARWTGPLTFGRTYTFTIRGGQVGVLDQSRNPDPNRGNPLPQDFTLTFTTEAAPAPSSTVVVNEIVTDPQRDWDDSLLGPGVSFDNLVGLNIGSTSDEWIEVFNKSSRLDLTGWTLVMKDSDYSEHVITAADGTVERYSGTGGAGTIAAGGYLVLGNPLGSMLDKVFVGLRNPSGVLVDAVFVDGAATAVENEAFARFPNGRDTNVEVVDFTKTTASILGPNNAGQPPPQPAVPFDVVLTEIVVDPQSDWNDSGGAAGQPFDATPFSGPQAQVTTSDEYVELANISAKLLKIKGWTFLMGDSSPSVYTIGSSSSVEKYFCNPPACTAQQLPTADAFPRGAILVLGNPSGSMNNDVFLELRDVAGQVIDKVQVGGRTASVNYEADDDRDGSVDEDRNDGEDDDGDGLVDEDPLNLNLPPGRGIPRNGDGNATGPNNEAFHRTRVTGVYQADWRRGFGSPSQEALGPLLQPVLEERSGAVLLAVLLGLGSARAARGRSRLMIEHSLLTGGIDR
jgi:hypothetical protein